ncbi:hypothetical protein ACHQM5_001335 [Ranunculus cassubicifolius]
MVNYSSCLPHWLSGLLGEKFFNPCLIHENVKKNEKNIYCLDCFISFCPHCVSPHRSHRLLQVRRYVYHDVIRLDDAEKLIDCDYVQSYTTNSAKVVFINERPQSRPFRGSGNICSTCDRSLQDSYLFCSLACKVAHIVKIEGGIHRHLYECDYLPLEEESKEESSIDDGQMTPDSVLESMLTSSGSSVSGGGGGGVNCRTFSCTATTEFLKKKRSPRTSYRPTFSTAEISSVMNKRKGKKGNPQRSPLY